MGCHMGVVTVSVRHHDKLKQGDKKENVLVDVDWSEEELFRGF